MRKICLSGCFAAALLGIASVHGSAHAQAIKESDGRLSIGQWETMVILREAPQAKLQETANWINNTCKPDQMHHVTGVLSQGGGAGADYNIVVFCKRGDGKLGAVTVSAVPWNGAHKFAETTLVGRDAVLLGFYDGSGGDAAFAVIRR